MYSFKHISLLIGRTKRMHGVSLAVEKNSGSIWPILINSSPLFTREGIGKFAQQKTKKEISNFLRGDKNKNNTFLSDITCFGLNVVCPLYKLKNISINMRVGR